MEKNLIRVLSKISDEEQDILNCNESVRQELYTNTKEFIVDRRKLMEEQKLIRLRPHTRFVDFPRHRHNYVELMYVCQGCIHHVIDEKTVDLQAGEILLLNQHSWHEIKKAGRDDIAINLIILPEFFDKPYTMLGFNNVISDFLINILRQQSSKGEYLYFKVSDILLVQNLMENMISLLVNEETNATILQTTMGLLFMHLASRVDCIDQRAAKQFDDLLIDESLDYIASHYQDATLTELAGRLNQSQYYLCRLIKEKTGETFKEMVQEKKFYRATELLTNSQLPINDIITSVGYENASYFHRKFKEKYKMTPKQYRTLFQK